MNEFYKNTDIHMKYSWNNISYQDSQLANILWHFILDHPHLQNRNGINVKNQPQNLRSYLFKELLLNQNCAIDFQNSFRKYI